MTTLTLRSGKGSALTFAELDDNFSNLNTDLTTTTTALGDYLPLAGGSLTGDITTTNEINIAEDEIIAWGGGTARPAIMGNKTDANLKFYVASAIRAQLNQSSMTFNVADVQINSKLSHNGDADNYLSFGANTLNLTQGGTSSLTATATDIDVFKTLDLDPAANTRSIHSKVDYTTGNNQIQGAFFDLNVSGNDAATADHSHIGIQVDVDTSYTGGDNSNEGRAYGIYATSTSSGDNDVVIGGYFLGQTSGTNANVSTNTTTVYGVYGQADQNRATLNSVQIGVYGYSAMDNGTAASTNQITNAYGVYGLHSNGTTGTTGRVGSAHGIYGRITHNEGEIGTAYGARTLIDHNAGEITTAYLYHGLYSVTGTPTTTNWGIKLLGSTVNQIEGTIRLSDGSVTAPTLCNDGDTNTGIYWPSDEVIGFSTGGTQRVNISSAGLDVTGAITVSGNVDGRDVAADGTKLDGIEALADVTDTTNVVAALTAGTNISIAANGTISSTDTTYSVGDGGLTQKNFTAALNTKLVDIEALADVTDTANVVASLTAGTNISIAANGTISSAAAYDDADVDAYINASITTTDISEGTRLYYTQARADARVDAGFTAKSTTNLSEGTRLYYTNARADARIAAASIFDLTDVASGTVVTNLNADKVDGFHGIGIYDLAGNLLNG